MSDAADEASTSNLKPSGSTTAPYRRRCAVARSFPRCQACLPGKLRVHSLHGTEAWSMSFADGYRGRVPSGGGYAKVFSK
jgi:hypothetical protein